MKTINYYIMSISLGIICLVFIEGILTMGSAFMFEQYGVFAWIMQIIAIVFTISLSLHIAINVKEDKQN
jgi:hypothetical protein